MPAQTLTLTSTGPEISRIVPGVMRLHEWGLDTAGLHNWVHAVLDMGISTFDHADIYGDYGNEALFGEVLKAEPSLRKKMILVTKCGIQLLSAARPETTVKHYNTSADYILAQVERSLRLLHTDYLDVLLIHRPDPLLNADAVAGVLNRLLRQGKVRFVGVSNHTPHQFALLQSRLDSPLVTNQVEFSVQHLDPIYDGTFDQAQQLRRVPMVWSPLGGGAIFIPEDGRSQRLNTVLRDVAAAHDGAGIDQIALAWLMQHPASPVPVVGTGKLERIQAAWDACDIILTRQEWFRILEASLGHEVA
jgi:predicted oxidoreductase